LPSGSSKKTNEPHGNSVTSLTCTPRPASSARAACASATVSCIPRAEPGSESTIPCPSAIEHAEPGGVSCTKRIPSLTVWVVFGDEPNLIGVEGLRAIDVDHGDRHEFELEVHPGLPFGVGVGRDTTIRPRSSSLRSVWRRADYLSSPIDAARCDLSGSDTMESECIQRAASEGELALAQLVDAEVPWLA